MDVLDRHEGLGKVTEVFVTGSKSGSEEAVKSVEGRGAKVHSRRLQKEDVNLGEQIARYYLCTGVPLRKQLSEWLAGQELVFEDFNF